ncbi:hypothetical protein TRFO_38496 [Tritrichomonas foetus]|uniref:Uncharacterized protein n=1 Tax=Tritrichomonas foetus TaxID=1144522 RepID=A0A1J4J9T7_9EUKA|nr:hypothetical protein TRFO_38496 [Tritrichomonas foetus]|eukprot:OHS95433.1 hypothetical protein TRFO_38496 [Tritrichomonas foetus]
MIAGPSSTSMTMSLQTSLAASFGSRYNGIIKQKPYKKIRNGLFLLLSYFDNVVPNFYPMHAIISIFRVIQFLGPCLVPGNHNLWNIFFVDFDGSPIIFQSSQGKVVSVLSVFFHIVPVSSRSQSSIVVELVYILSIFLFFVGIILISINYQKNAKLQRPISIAFSIFINTCGYLLSPICANIMGETIARIINRDTNPIYCEPLSYDLTIEILILVLAFLCQVAWYIFFFKDFNNFVAV